MIKSNKFPFLNNQRSQKTLKSFIKESPEAAIQQIEVENKVATADTLDASVMGSDDEKLCCFAIDAIINELSTEYKPDQLDMTQITVQQEIYQMLNVIMSEDAEIRAENVSSYHKRADDEPVGKHCTFVFGQWSDNAGYTFETQGGEASIFSEPETPREYQATQEALRKNCVAFYTFFKTKWTELIAARKQQEIYQFLSFEEQNTLLKFFDMLQWAWKNTLVELYARMTAKAPTYKYTPDNFFKGESIANIMQETIQTLDDADKKGRATLLDDLKYLGYKPNSTTSINEVVRNYYRNLQKMFHRMQQVQSRLSHGPFEVFELPNKESLFLRTTELPSSLMYNLEFDSE